MSGAPGDWVGDFAGGDWTDQPPPPPPPATNGGARETVEIVICPNPKCRSRDVRCTKRQPTHSNWTCDKCFNGWKEPPKVGDSKGFIV